MGKTGSRMNPPGQVFSVLGGETCVLQVTTELLRYSPRFHNASEKGWRIGGGGEGCIPSCAKFSEWGWPGR